METWKIITNVILTVIILVLTIPISFGVSVRYNLTDKLSVNTGLNYTRYTSTRERYYYTGGADMDKQYAHYLGIPVRLDRLAGNKKHFNF